MKKDESWSEINEITDGLEKLIASKHSTVLNKYNQLVKTTEKLVET